MSIQIVHLDVWHANSVFFKAFQQLFILAASTNFNSAVFLGVYLFSLTSVEDIRSEVNADKSTSCNPNSSLYSSSSTCDTVSYFPQSCPTNFFMCSMLDNNGRLTKNKQSDSLEFELWCLLANMKCNEASWLLGSAL